MEAKLDRFLEAQAKEYPVAMREILMGRRAGEWIWFIYPQLYGNGHSEKSLYYGIHGLEEAQAYLHHPRLELRLLAAMDAILFHKESTAMEILGSSDAAKLRSSATLFHLARPEEAVFKEVLKAFFGGKPCKLTVEAIDQFA